MQYWPIYFCTRFVSSSSTSSFLSFFFNPTSTTEIYTLSLHDALPILLARDDRLHLHGQRDLAHVHHRSRRDQDRDRRDRKSTRLNSSHVEISYAVFCLKKKNKNDSREETSRSSQTKSRSNTYSISFNT